MNRRTHLIGLSLAMFSLVEMPAQKQTPANAAASQNQASRRREFGQSYATLRAEQKKLLEDFIRRYNATTGSKATPEEAYDDARMWNGCWTQRWSWVFAIFPTPRHRLSTPSTG